VSWYITLAIYSRLATTLIEDGLHIFVNNGTECTVFINQRGHTVFISP